MASARCEERVGVLQCLDVEVGYIGGKEWPAGEAGNGEGLTGLGGRVVCAWCRCVCWWGL